MNTEIFVVGGTRFKTVLHFCDGDKTYSPICKECQNEELIKQFIIEPSQSKQNRKGDKTNE